MNKNLILFSLLLFSFFAFADNGTLNVTTIPSSASVFLNGTFAGFTPMHNSSIPEGTYSVRLTKDGYQTHNTSTAIRANQITEINVTLNRTENITSNLTVYSNPSMASVIMTGPNGTFQFTTPRTLNLKPGTYSFNFSMNGYYANNTNLTIGNYTNTTLNATMVPRGIFLRANATVSFIYPANYPQISSRDFVSRLSIRNELKLLKDSSGRFCTPRYNYYGMPRLVPGSRYYITAYTDSVLNLEEARGG